MNKLIRSRFFLPIVGTIIVGCGGNSPGSKKAETISIISNSVDCENLLIASSSSSSPQYVCLGVQEALKDNPDCESLLIASSSSSSPQYVCQGVQEALKGNPDCESLPIASSSSSSPQYICLGWGG